MRRLPVLVILILCSLNLPAQDRAASLRKILLDANSETVLVAAHRASHKSHPENSIPAIRDAIRLGVDILELDVKITADRVPILMHDRTIDRTTTGNGDPEKINWSELKKLSLLHNGAPGRERIPTLEEALLEVKGKALIDLDMKTDAVPEVLEVIRKTGMEEYVVFFDGDREVLTNIVQSGTFLVMPRADDLATTREVLDAFNPPIVHIDETFNTKEVSSLIKSRNARAWINALGQTDREIAAGNGLNAIQLLLAGGANIVQTDEPQRLLELLYELGKRPDIKPVLSSKGGKKKR
jgi:glycerophosphoryl diester phosphodiesterase